MVAIHRYVLVLAVTVLSTSAFADHEEEFMQAFENKEPDKAVQIFKANENNFDPNFRRTSGDYVGATPLAFASGNQQWDIVRRMLDLYANADVDASPLEGPYRGKTPLWFAAYRRQWDIVKRMLELHPNANVDASPAEGSFRGATPLWFTAPFKRWDIVKRMLELKPNANVDASPVEGPYRGSTPLWHAAGLGEWDIVRRMLEHHPNADVDASPLEGRYRGGTPLLAAAIAKQWDVVGLILSRHPEANLGAFLQEGPNKGKDVPYWMAAAPVALKKLCVIHLMNQDKEDSQLRDRLEKPGWGGELVTNLQVIFRRATVAFTNLVSSDVSRVQESSILDPLSKDLRWKIALTTLRQEDADLKQVPDFVLKQLLIRFMAVYKKVDYDERSIELVAAKVLDALAPVDARNPETITEARKQRITKVRKWIIDELKDAVRRGLLPGAPDAEVRDALMRALSAKSLSSITRKWIRERIRAYGQERMRDEEGPASRRREIEGGG